MSDTQENIIRVYEAGYQISPSQEARLDEVVSAVRVLIEQNGGSLISEGAPVLSRLAFDVIVKEGAAKVTYDRAFFGWLKFESTDKIAGMVREEMQNNPIFLRSIVFGTVREETRAKLKTQQLREVKRGEVLKTVRKEEASAPVSEEEIDKALETITA